jgi:hypothetical protein
LSPAPSKSARAAGDSLLPDRSWEVRGSLERPLLHLWSDNCNLTRRVLSIDAKSNDRLALAVEQFGRSKPARMEIVRLAYSRSARQLSREEFCAQLRRILAEQFSDETVEKLSTAADRRVVGGSRRRNSGRHRKQPDVRVVVVRSLPPTASGKNLNALRLFLPKGQAAALAHRVAALHPRLQLQLFELDSATPPALSRTARTLDAGQPLAGCFPRRSDARSQARLRTSFRAHRRTFSICFASHVHNA